jgi:Flp pilus assembly protein protease CpaA
MELTLQILRLALSWTLLIYASASDLSTREVSDRVWLIGIPPCLLLDCVDLYLGTLDLASLLASLGTAFFLGFFLCYIGFYGGADGKALMLVAAAAPSYPMTELLAVKILPLPILFVFFASTLFSVFYPLKVSVLNLSDYVRGKRLLQGIDEGSRLKRLLLYITTRRVRFDTLKDGIKHFPAEKVVVEGGSPRRRPIYFLHAEADIDKLVENLEAYKDLFHDGVLASPTTPMVVFQTAAFVCVSFLLHWPLY